MKFLITRQNKDGSFDEVGMTNRTIYSDLKTINGAARRARKLWPNVGLRIEAFSNERFYGEPSQTVFIEE